MLTSRITERVRFPKHGCQSSTSAATRCVFVCEAEALVTHSAIARRRPVPARGTRAEWMATYDIPAVPAAASGGLCLANEALFARRRWVSPGLMKPSSWPVASSGRVCPYARHVGWNKLELTSVAV